MGTIGEFVKISKYAGERFDLIQAGGGNTSVKINNLLYIKSSGVSLSDVNNKSGYSVLDNNKLKLIFNDVNLLSAKSKYELEIIADKFLMGCIKNDSFRPSIESFFHSVLKEYVLHTHPLVVNIINCSNDWNVVLKALFPDSICIDYYTPGIELSIKLEQVIKKKLKTEIIFLQNHGLIINGDSADRIIELNEQVINKIEKHLNFNFTRYQICNKISELINNLFFTHYVTYLSEDSVILSILDQKKELIECTPIFPDMQVFCGFKILKLTSLSDIAPIIDYISDYNELPKIIYFNNYIYIMATNVKRAKEAEDVLKIHLLILANIDKNIHFIEKDELKYLSKWESEKYRQKL